MVKNSKSINNGGRAFYLPSSFLSKPPPPNRGFTMADLYEMAKQIIDKRGGDEYKRAWLEHWLSDPDHEDEFMSLLLKKQVAEATKKKKTTDKPKKIKL